VAGFEAFVSVLRRRVWGGAHYICFGSAANHGALMLGAWAVLRGGWADGGEEATFPELRGAAGVSAGVMGAICVCCGLGPARMAAMWASFPYDLFMADVGGGGGGASRVAKASQFLASLASRRSLMGGFSLRAVIHTLLREAGVRSVDTGRLTFADFRARFGKDLRVLALSLTDHRPVEFSSAATPSASVLEACVASMSIPGLFPPARVGGWGEFVDGAMVDPYGLSLCADVPRHRRLHLYKYWKGAGYDARRDPGALSVLLHCLVAVADRSLPPPPPPTSPALALCAALNEMPILIEAPLAQERDIDPSIASAVSALNLFAAPDVVSLMRLGARSVEARLLGIYVLLRVSAASAASAASVPTSLLRPLENPGGAEAGGGGGERGGGVVGGWLGLGVDEGGRLAPGAVEGRGEVGGVVGEGVA
jgi:hypothetical protein